jgi:large subunit ribosomal protein L22
MLSGNKLSKYRKSAGMGRLDLARAMTSGSPAKVEAKCMSAIDNWERGLLKPTPSKEEISKISSVLGVEEHTLVVWQASHRWAPMAPRKVRLVTDLIQGRYANEALDILEFTNKRAAVYVKQVLKSAIANADEQEADLSKLYISEAKVDEGGIRPGTKRWRPKDRGRALPELRLSSHITITVDID